ncbi:MAG: FkbM family methyltransferase [Flavobacteriia bacterium]|nr:FkbM family methyltransferase [Flavobacteriia bacterium]
MSSILKFKYENNTEVYTVEDDRITSFIKSSSREPLHRIIVNQLISRNFLKNKNLIDLGCWMGDMSIPWAKNTDGIVYAIDPSEENIKFVKKMCEKNSISNIECIQKGISNKESKVSTNHDLNHCMFTALEEDTRNINWKNIIHATTLDKLYEDKKITDIGFIHLDVEGFENRVVEGAHTIISKYKPAITFEQHIESSDNPRLVIDLLVKQGYKHFFVINETMSGMREDCRNLLAVFDEANLSNIIKDITPLIDSNVSPWSKNHGPLIPVTQNSFQGYGKHSITV